jgi:hypothetical protein
MLEAIREAGDHLSVADLDNVCGGRTSAGGLMQGGMLTITMTIGDSTITLSATKDTCHMTTSWPSP